MEPKGGGESEMVDALETKEKFGPWVVLLPLRKSGKKRASRGDEGAGMWWWCLDPLFLMGED